MAENVTGTTVGDVKYVVAYLDVNTNNLYNANGNLYGNNTLTSYLDNEFTLELHYVQDISTSSNPEEWVVWDGLKDLTVSSTLAFDDNYLHAVRGTIVADASAGSPSVSVDVTDEINKDTLSRYGVLLVNPFGDEEDQLMIPYSSFQQVSGTTFSFIVDDAQGLEASVTKDSPVRVSDPLYMFINANDIYEANIPNRYEEGVFKFPVNVMSRKLLNALDYSGSTGVSGTMEHKIYTNKNTITGITVTGSTTVLKRDIDDDEVAGVHIAGVKTTIGEDTVYPRDASHDTTNNGTAYYAWMNTENNTVAFYTKTTNVTVGTLLYDEMYFTQLEETVSALVDVVNPYLFCAWTNGATVSPIVYWTKGNEVDSGDSVYNVSGGTATVVSGTTASPNIITEPILFRTFAFPFIVRNLVDYGVSLTIPTEDIDWTKEYVISIIRNNMEEVTGKASNGAYGVVLIGENINVNNGVISIKNASTSNKGVVQLVDNVSDTTSTDKAVTPNYVKTVADTKQANLNADIATVEQIVKGSTNAHLVDADGLTGALSLGQAVDVSCPAEHSSFSKISIDGGTTYQNLTSEILKNTYLDEFILQVENTDGFNFGWTLGNTFPKHASGLKYLFMVDFRMLSGRDVLALYDGASESYYWKQNADSGYKRAWLVTTSDVFRLHNNNCTSPIRVAIKNWRQYEVTNLTDEAIQYLAQLENPDDFFRSADAYTVLDKYLVKQDMVAPWIPTIGMPDNSDLTVASGLSYKITYTDDDTHNVTVDTIPTNAYGWDSHIQMFVKGASNVKFKEPLILMDALTSNAGHNLIVKYRNGQALVYVDDLNAGNIVLSTTGSTVGTLNYYLQQNPGTGQENYIIFGAVTDGAVCDASSVSVAYNTNIIGNGTDKTTITGTYNVANGNTMNLQDVIVSGSTFNGAGFTNFNNLELVDVKIVKTSASDSVSKYTLSNVVIPSGSTVFASGSNHYRTLYGLSNVKIDGVLNITDQVIYPTSITGSGIIDFNEYGNGCITFTTTGTKILNGIMIKNGGYGNGAIQIGGGDVSITNCTIVGGTSGWNGANMAISYVSTNVFCKDCIFLPGYSVHENHGFICGTDAKARFVDCVFADESDSFYCNGATVSFAGNHLFGDRSYIRSTYGVDRVIIEDDTTFDLRGSTITIPQTGEEYVVQPYTHPAGFYFIAAGASVVIGNNFTVELASGKHFHMDACTIKGSIDHTGTFSFRGTAQGLVATPSETWYLNDIVLDAGSSESFILDFSKVETLKLGNCVFSGTAKINKEPMRIQLPSSTVINVRNITGLYAGNTKIVKAPVILVGEDASAPSGNATIEYDTNNTSSISGIGTYITKDGSNDFRPITSNFIVTNLGPDERSGSLGGELTSATNAAVSTQKTQFVQFGQYNKGSASAAADSNKVVSNTMILTSDYKPVFGGDYSITSGGVMQSFGSNTTTQVSGAPLILSNVEIPTNTTLITMGGVSGVAGMNITGGGVLNLNQHNCDVAYSYNTPAIISGTTVTNGYGTSGGAFIVSASVSATDVTFVNNTATQFGGVQYGGGVFTRCTFTGNTANRKEYGNALYNYNRGFVLSDCVFNENQTVATRGGQGYITLIGSNVLKSEILPYSDGTAQTINVSAGAVVNLTGNTNSTPLNPGLGAVIFEAGGATVYPFAGSAMVIAGATVGSISNDNTVLLAGISNESPAYYMETITLDKNWSISNATLVKHPNTSSVETVLQGHKLTLNSVTFLSSEGYFNVGSEMEATDCTFSGCFIWSNRKTITNCTINDLINLRNNGSVILSGTIKFGTYGCMQYNQGSNSEVTLEDGCILDATSTHPSQVLLNPAVTQTGKITVAEGGTATLRYKSGSSTLTKTLSGSYTTIYANGTVVVPT